MKQPRIKPAVVLDDDANWAATIARGVRRFGGLPVKHFFSIEAFCRHHKIKYNDSSALAGALKEYSAVITDNNFEGAKGEPGDGYLGGGDFLLTYAGPALKKIPAKERPIVMSFAPSSQSVIAKYEGAMWDQYGISSFHKFWENPAIGLAIRIAREYGVTLSRESVVSKICGQDMGDSGFGQPKADFFADFMFDHTDREFPGESFTQVEGDAKPMEWSEIVASLSGRLNMKADEFNLRVETEVAKRKASIEGAGNRQSRK